jgi:hypothetical protein
MMVSLYTQNASLVPFRNTLDFYSSLRPTPFRCSTSLQCPKPCHPPAHANPQTHD